MASNSVIRKLEGNSMEQHTGECMHEEIKLSRLKVLKDILSTNRYC